VVDYGGVLALLPGFQDPVHEGAGMLQGEDSLTAEMVEEHRKERERVNPGQYIYWTALLFWPIAIMSLAGCV